ncbi:(E)-4-hydroxy-3-methylbut-2-enyl-diphosphate synthase [Marinoscillum furvescens]|uniref:4-hydroxy-3-methylbut-2-en-1-yl diphosphate synthase (flavodoxin) n=1 Tax=Marinoscillum furvescens DSM 4134 TaxID=1122208 RepID=A0A3D9L021_MARFU|nr:(E)-4-hydroxy-3-methylbut-2-enyl-diphosphate synthase [Marinoscillum furvescens]RED96247.1 4-hydroxy-3-methylbut-2-en-1-yl diphosphate synthase [Marinoscillum furvescens DSM 4134]
MNSADELLTPNAGHCASLTAYQRRKTLEVNIGGVPLGGENPIRVQSMTTVDTMDTDGSVEQALRMVESGCEYVRITAPSIKEAENLSAIKNELRARGCNVPLVADIHFTPNAAELAAQIVEKVRVNPGNYADKKRFEEINYTDETYQAELERIREKFTPLVEICKANGTAMRIGTNHGSLSDRIMSRYGDTPKGMVESALEFIRICESLEYYDLVISMKSSNPQVMVQAYRLLVKSLDEEGLKPYPLHLGVTEAGEAEDGRIKSAVGIGTLLEDGLGDTVRVSLTEEPEVESPVGRILVDRLNDRAGHATIPETDFSKYNPYEYQKRASAEVANFGGENVPRVIADLSGVSDLSVKDLKAVGHFYLPELDKWTMNDLGCDYIYTGSQPAGFMLPNGLREIIDFAAWQQLKNNDHQYPLLTAAQLTETLHPELNFLRLKTHEVTETVLSQLKERTNVVLLLGTDNAHAMADLRRVFVELMNQGIDVPVVIERSYAAMSEDAMMMFPATDMGGLLIDGFGDGAMIGLGMLQQEKEALLATAKLYNNIVFGVLQAARTRITKTEYISCPSCGRTLFDLQETTAMIRKRTDHLKGVKIGIMGCIVNGPGEMADADYGYVGSGKGKITLYKGKEVMKRGVPSERALDELIELIREDGKWTEPQKVGAQ